jgi:hypothetical protein
MTLGARLPRLLCRSVNVVMLFGAASPCELRGKCKTATENQVKTEPRTRVRVSKRVVCARDRLYTKDVSSLNLEQTRNEKGEPAPRGGSWGGSWIQSIKLLVASVSDPLFPHQRDHVQAELCVSYSAEIACCKGQQMDRSAGRTVSRTEGPASRQDRAHTYPTRASRFSKKY